MEESLEAYKALVEEYKEFVKRYEKLIEDKNGMIAMRDLKIQVLEGKLSGKYFVFCRACHQQHSIEYDKENTEVIFEEVIKKGGTDDE